MGGQVSGGQSPYCTTATGGTACTAVFFESPEGYGFTWATSLGSYSMTPAWPIVATTTGTLHAFEFQYSTSGGYPTGYLGYGEVPDVTLANGGTFTRNVAMAAVGNLTIAGAATPAPSYTVDDKQLILRLTGPTRQGLRLADDTTSNVGFNFIGPLIHDSTFTLFVEAVDAKGTRATVSHAGIKATTTSLALAIPAGPALILPVDKATGLGLGTSFSWQAFAGGVNLFVAWPSSTSTNPTFAVFTAGTTASIPDLRSIGLTLPSIAAYQWQVLGFAPVGSIDEMAGSSGSSIILDTAETEFSKGYSAVYSFTTQ